MKIKDIREAYKAYRCEHSEKNHFVVYDFKDGNGKVVIIVRHHPDKYVGRYVVQVVRVSDGKELLDGSQTRPCDSLDDAIDVAGEMF